MKLIILFIALLFTRCTSNTKATAQPINQRIDSFIVVKDTVYLPSSCDSLKRINDSLKSELFLANYKIEKVRFYINLCNKKPSQNIFIKGWITRAIK